MPELLLLASSSWNPIWLVGAIIGSFAIAFITAFALMKDKKEAIGFDRTLKDREITRRLLSYAKPYWKSLIFVAALMCISIAYDIIGPQLLGRVTEMLSENEKYTVSDVMKHVVLYASILVVSLVCTYFQAIVLQRTGQKMISRLREDTFSHIESLSHEQLHHLPVGKLVTRVTNDAESISIFTNLLVNLLKNFLLIFGVLAAMFAVNVVLTLMVLTFVPFVVLFTVIFRKFSRRAHRKVKDGTTAVNTFLSENLSGMKITQLFCREDRKLKEFDINNDRLARAKARQIFVFGIFRPVVYMLYISSVLCLLYLAGKSYIDDMVFFGQTISVRVLVIFYSYISKFFNPIQTLAEQFNRLQSAYASAEKIFIILDTPPVVKDKEDAVELEHISGNIAFEHVWFAYEGEEWVLRDVSFEVKAGETAAFVGATGAGKTTILSLLVRNYEIQRGRILVDGIDITTVKITSLRRHFGQMLQDVFLFAGTIRSNILLGLEGKSDEEVMEACRYVNAHSFIDRLSGGLDEPVRERGNNFSAGQRQLLSFARTVIHRPEVMILDEATANIDAETEKLIQNSLEKMMNIGTMLIVAHRLSTIREADCIFVLDHGQIIEKGTHSELIAGEGRYHALYMMQYHREMLNAAKHLEAEVHTG